MQFVIARRDDSLTRQSTACDGGVRTSAIPLSETQWIATDYALAMTKCGVNLCTVREQHTMSLRGENEVSDTAIHRVSREAFRLVSSLMGSQWIATGFQPSR